MSGEGLDPGASAAANWAYSVQGGRQQGRYTDLGQENKCHAGLDQGHNEEDDGDRVRVEYFAGVRAQYARRGEEQGAVAGAVLYPDREGRGAHRRDRAWVVQDAGEWGPDARQEDYTHGRSLARIGIQIDGRFGAVTK